MTQTRWLSGFPGMICGLTALLLALSPAGCSKEEKKRTKARTGESEPALQVDDDPPFLQLASPGSGLPVAEPGVRIFVSKKRIWINDQEYGIPVVCKLDGRTCTEVDYTNPSIELSIDPMNKEHGKRDSLLIVPLKNGLEKAAAGSHKALVIPDRHIPFRMIAEVVYTAAIAELHDMSFAIRDRESDEVLVQKIAVPRREEIVEEERVSEPAPIAASGDSNPESSVEIHFRVDPLKGDDLGVLETAEVMGVFEQNRGAFRDCYEKRRPAAPNLTGVVVFLFIIDPAGGIDRIEAKSNSTGDGPLAECIVQAIRGWKFSTPAGGSAAFVSPVAFQRKSDSERAADAEKSDDGLIPTQEIVSLEQLKDSGSRIRVIGSAAGDGEMGSGDSGKGTLVSALDKNSLSGGKKGKRFADVKFKDKKLKAGVTTGRVSVTGGGLDRAIIKKFINRQKGSIIYCYKKGVQSKPDLEGKVIVKFVISPKGKVMRPGIKKSTLGSASVESCIVSRLGMWRFPAPKNGGAVGVSYPFLFNTRGSGDARTVPRKKYIRPKPSKKKKAATRAKKTEPKTKPKKRFLLLNTL